MLVSHLGNFDQLAYFIISDVIYFCTYALSGALIAQSI
jgi:hypothetical protein